MTTETLREKYELYQHERFPGKWLVASGNPTGFGDTIHPTREDAESYVSITSANERYHAEASAKREAEEAERQRKEDERLALVREYCKGMTKMGAGKVIKTLSIQLRYCDLGVKCRHEALEIRVKDGWRFKEYSFGERLASPDDHFSTLTKTEEDYARWLIAREEA